MTRRPRVAFVVNGGPESAMGERAAAFATRLTSRFDVRLVYRTGGIGLAVPRLLRELVAFCPAACYVFDMSAAGIAAAGLFKHLTGTPFVVDTGDAIVELGRVLGRGQLGMLATKLLETYSLRAASGVVVRGSFHRELLNKRGIRAEFIPDGVSVNQFAGDGSPSRDSSQPLVIGLVGSSVWIPTRQTCYGSDLVELVRLLNPHLPVRGVLIGGGTGIGVLKRRCREYGIEDLVEFAGRVPYNELPGRLREFDICLSTQSNDVIGNVRTTGKLPLYLAAGRFVLASRAGEAARILPPEMLVEFHGSVDPEYPIRLASRVAELMKQGTDFSHRPECVALAYAHFEYDRSAFRFIPILDRVMNRRGILR